MLVLHCLVLLVIESHVLHWGDSIAVLPGIFIHRFEVEVDVRAFLEGWELCINAIDCAHERFAELAQDHVTGVHHES